MLVDLDIEFSSTSGKVFEVGAGEHYSGKVLIDARIQHDCATRSFMNIRMALKRIPTRRASL
jgi:hypothetical protein